MLQSLRYRQAAGSIPVAEQPSAAESKLETMVNAAMGGHDLGPSEPAETLTGGSQARCRRCGQTAWVADNGLMYSLLETDCPADEAGK